MSTLLETERLVLRRLADTEADAALLFELDSDPEVMRHIGPFTLPTVEAYRERIRDRYLAQYAEHPQRGCFALEEKPGREFVGWIFLRRATEYLHAKDAGWTRPTDVELGYRLRRAAWGRGLASEAAAALVRLALSDPEVTAVVAAALVANRGSTRVMEKAGLTRVREFAMADRGTAVMYAVCPPGCEPPHPGGG
jgi:RimJ/RimL family protein N-acetyltransferase